MVGCDESDVGEDYLEKPIIIIEILSDLTEHIDKREKLLAYQSISSVKSCILIAQDKVWVQRYQFQQIKPLILETYTDLQDNVYLSDIDLTVKLTSIYEDVL